MKTGEQVYRGLAGVYLLEDEISRKLETDKKLPSGKYDIPVLVQDRRFKQEANGVRELAYKTMEMDSDGMLGDKILVNGAVLPKLEVSTRQYRFKIYNVSNARSYDFALSDGVKFKIVGTDGGLLPNPVEVDHIMLGAAERAEIVVDFGKYSKGDKVMLISKAFNGSPMMGMMSNMNNNGGSTASNTMNRRHGENSGMNPNNNQNTTNLNPDNEMNNNAMNSENNMGNNREMNNTPTSNMNEGEMLVNGKRLDIMRFDITTESTDDISLYTALPANADINTQRLTANDASKTRNFVMTMAMGNSSDMNGANQSNSNSGMTANMGNNNSSMGAGSANNSSGMGAMSFVINGKPFDINRIDEVINLSEGDTEIWSIQNRSPMAHPFHAHAIQWQVLDRNGSPATGTDLGWKDTVLVQPGETVRFIGRFDPAINYGNYMYHCHILEHEDAGMMGFFRIQ
jgi:FtsP/CotA-like multicopper oxidase with cupredoxin domain